MYEKLLGLSVIGVKVVDKDEEAYLYLSDGSTLEILADCGEDECGGYGAFTLNIPKGFDFTDNVITSINYIAKESETAVIGSVTLGIFTNNRDINVTGAYGSNSGFGYGQFVSIKVVGGADNE